MRLSVHRRLQTFAMRNFEQPVHHAHKVAVSRSFRTTVASLRVGLGQCLPPSCELALSIKPRRAVSVDNSSRHGNTPAPRKLVHQVSRGVAHVKDAVERASATPDKVAVSTAQLPPQSEAPPCVGVLSITWSVGPAGGGGIGAGAGAGVGVDAAASRGFDGSSFGMSGSWSVDHELLRGLTAGKRRRRRRRRRRQAKEARAAAGVTDKCEDDGSSGDSSDDDSDDNRAGSSDDESDVDSDGSSNGSSDGSSDGSGSDDSDSSGSSATASVKSIDPAATPARRHAARLAHKLRRHGLEVDTPRGEEAGDKDGARQTTAARRRFRLRVDTDTIMGLQIIPGGPGNTEDGKQVCAPRLVMRARLCRGDSRRCAVDAEPCVFAAGRVAGDSCQRHWRCALACGAFATSPAAGNDCTPDVSAMLLQVTRDDVEGCPVAAAVYRRFEILSAQATVRGNSGAANPCCHCCHSHDGPLCVNCVDAVPCCPRLTPSHFTGKPQASVMVFCWLNTADAQALRKTLKDAVPKFTASTLHSHVRDAACASS